MGLIRSLWKDATRKKGRKGKQYGRPSRTMNGTFVKSHAEQKIGDYLTRNGIRYQYEKGAQTDALIFKKTFAKPDLFLPDYNVYVEYWGLVAAEKDYRRTMKWKMAQYHENHIKFISLYPRNMDNLDWIFRAKFKDVVGFDLPSRSVRASVRTPLTYFCTQCGTKAEVGGRFCGNCGKGLN